MEHREETASETPDTRRAERLPTQPEAPPLSDERARRAVEMARQRILERSRARRR